MTDLSFASTAPIASSDESEDHSFKTIILFSCVGLFASVCLMVAGIDFNIDWI